MMVEVVKRWVWACRLASCWTLSDSGFSRWKCNESVQTTAWVCNRREEHRKPSSDTRPSVPQHRTRFIPHASSWRMVHAIRFVGAERSAEIARWQC